MKNIILMLLILGSFKLSAQEQKEPAQEPVHYNHSLAFDFGLGSSKDISFNKSLNDEQQILFPTVNINYSGNISGPHWFTTGVGYYQVGDVYKYYTGRGSQKTDVRIHVNSLKIPLLYSLILDKGKKVNLLMRVGPSIDFMLGEPVINAETTLNSPDGFRSNITQGEVEMNQLILLNISAGITFKNKQGITNYLELTYYGTGKGIFKESSFGSGQSSYRIIALKFGVILFNR